MAKEELDRLMAEHDTESMEFYNELISDMVYLASFGLEDPIRPEVQKSIKRIRFGEADENDNKRGAKNSVNIRMISGDHIETCKYVAKKVGIITENEAKIKGVFMTGEMFRQEIGGYSKSYNEEKKIWEIKLENKEKFR